MTSSEQGDLQQPSRGSRRFFWLAVGICAGIAAYTGGWFWAAGQVKSETAAFLTRVHSRGQEADCTNAQAKGYPFRLGLFCDAIAFSDPKLGISFSGSGLRSAAQIYEPAKVVGELDRLTGDFAAPGAAIHANWQDIRFSTRLAKPVPLLVSAQSGPVTVTSLDGQPLGSASDSIVHFRPRADDLDIAGQLNGVTATAVQGLPPLIFAIDGTIANGVVLLQSPDRSLLGASGELRNLSVTAPDGSLALSGTASVDASGLIDADLKIDLKNPPAIVRLASIALPEWASRLQQVEKLIGLMGDNPTVPVSIVKGEIKLGFFTIGQIPPVR